MDIKGEYSETLIFGTDVAALEDLSCTVPISIPFQVKCVKVQMLVKPDAVTDAANDDNQVFQLKSDLFDDKIVCATAGLSGMWTPETVYYFSKGWVNPEGRKVNGTYTFSLVQKDGGTVSLALVRTSWIFKLVFFPI